jgi:glycosyltransferase involved in cell wall biosynthesis
MKVYINREPVSGPWGGGNKTVSRMCELLLENKNDVVFDLDDNNIDLIFCFDPRPNSKGIWYKDFLDYREKNRNVKIIQRVGDVGTHGKPELTNLVRATVIHSDFLIFPSVWAKDYIEYSGKNFAIIKNRPLKCFHVNKKKYKKPKHALKVVTHHWSTNPKKGFNVYSELVEILRKEKIEIEFTYIGRTPDEFQENNVRVIEPKDVDFLSRELPNYDIYFTASLEEAGANHVLEGIAAGLPVVYHHGGGSVPEYSSKFGSGFKNNTEIPAAFSSVIKNFDKYKSLCMEYNEDIDQTVKEYMDIMCQIK